jgi:hypothetical protein
VHALEPPRGAARGDLAAGGPDLGLAAEAGDHDARLAHDCLVTSGASADELALPPSSPVDDEDEAADEDDDAAGVAFAWAEGFAPAAATAIHAATSSASEPAAVRRRSSRRRSTRSAGMGMDARIAAGSQGALSEV